MNIKTQTIVSQTDLDDAGKTWGFGAAHAFVEFGKEDGKGNRVFDSEIWARIKHNYAGKAPPAAPMVFAAPTPRQPAKAADIIAARRTVCFGDETGKGKCEWNIDGICQHPACKTCPGKQKNSGALEALIKQPFATCGAQKWNFKLP
jgi:hypothetical protein